MWLLSIFNAGLLALPVAITTGIYLAVEWQLILHGPPQGSDITSDAGGSHSTDGSITTSTYCQKEYGITPFPGRYTFNPNQWGDIEQDLGDLCLNITTNSQTPKKSTAAAGFSATWAYPVGPADEPVHAFPNAKLELSDILPIQIGNMSALAVDVEWSYALGNEATNDTDSASLTASGLNANVCIDMFLASDANKTDPTTSAYEVMVWFGQWGLATQPIGLAQGVKETQSINGTSFDLFYGSNSNGQKVFTWVAEQNTTQFTGNLGSLVQTLGQSGGPVSDDYLGYIAFGSEALSSLQNVTFSVPVLQMDVQSA